MDSSQIVNHNILRLLSSLTYSRHTRFLIGIENIIPTGTMKRLQIDGKKQNITKGIFGETFTEQD